jgi:Leucine-rich repeat (LRR) protein
VRIGQLEFLEVLFLDNNCLEMIPIEIGNLGKSLKVLKLAHNKLKTLTNRIRDLTNLEILHL